MYDTLIQELTALLEPEKILLFEPMKNHTSFRVGGPADVFLKLSAPEQLSGVLFLLQREGLPWFVLGNGSNLLVSDQGYRGVILALEGGFETIETDGTVLTAGAAARMNDVAAAAAEASLTGLEFASGIPGTIGGGLVMNAGAYGGEISQVIESARVMEPSGTIYTLQKEELRLGYRNSIFKQKPLLILQVRLRLRPGRREEILQTMEEYNLARREKQPLEYPSAGSTFKRPKGHYAGKLIMEAGLKGAGVGGARVSDKHCGFVINTGGATAEDIRQLMKNIQREVRERFGVMLEPEVIFLGEETEDEICSGHGNERRRQEYSPENA